ncbi:MAG: T9SS type A sorting domain-containing protein [Bacteroidota bacterium]
MKTKKPYYVLLSILLMGLLSIQGQTNFIPTWPNETVTFIKDGEVISVPDAFLEQINDGSGNGRTMIPATAEALNALFGGNWLVFDQGDVVTLVPRITVITDPSAPGEVKFNAPQLTFEVGENYIDLLGGSTELPIIGKNQSSRVPALLQVPILGDILTGGQFSDIFIGRVEMPINTLIRDGVVYVPFRYVQQFINNANSFTVWRWDGPSRTVELKSFTNRLDPAIENFLRGLGGAFPSELDDGSTDPGDAPPEAGPHFRPQSRGNGDENSSFLIASADADANLGIGHNITLNGDNGIQFTFTSFEDNLQVVPSTVVSSLETFNTSFPNISVADIEFPNFDGVDFRDVSISGLDIDNVQGTVNFILNGTKLNQNTNILDGDRRLLQRVFLEALTIPNEAHFVDLKPNNAIADNEFKQTKMGELFFEADLRLKTDFLASFWDRGGVNVFQIWFERLYDTDRDKFIDILNRNINLTPDIQLAGTIVPVLPSVNGEQNKVFVSDASYDINMRLERAFVDLEGKGLSQSEKDYVTNVWNDFYPTLVSRRDATRTDIANNLNNGAYPEYKKIKQILPAVIAAHWYKNQFRDNNQAQLYRTIDVKDLDGSTTGIRVRQSFDQNLWDNLSNQLLATPSVYFEREGGGVTYSNNSIRIRGGMITDYTFLDNWGTQLSSSQRSLTSDVPTTSFVEEGGENYINGGGIFLDLPDPGINGVFVNDKNGPSNMYNHSNEFTDYIGSSFKAYFRILNTGSKRTGRVPYTFTIKRGNSTVRLVSSRTDALDPFEEQIITIDYSPNQVGTYDVELFLDPNQTQEDASRGNNYYKKTVKIIGYDINENSELNDIVFSGEKDYIARSGTLTTKNLVTENSSRLFIEAQTKVILKTGTHFKEGSKASVKIVDLDAIRVAANINSISRNGKGNIQDLDFASLVKPKKLAEVSPEILDYKSDLLSATDNPELHFINEGNVLDELQGGEENTLSFHPNPVVDVVDIFLQLKNDDKVSISLYEMSGKKLKNLVPGATMQAGLNQQQIDLSSVPQGMYILSAKGSELTASRILIKE